MKRTIEDSIKYLIAMRKTYIADSEMLSIAIETMYKYQKIKEIMGDSRRYPMDCLFNVREVIEDGNDNW